MVLNLVRQNILNLHRLSFIIKNVPLKNCYGTFCSKYITANSSNLLESSIVVLDVSRTYSSGKSNFSKDKKQAKKDGKNKNVLTDEELAQVIDVEQFRKQLLQAVDKLKNSYAKHLSIRTSVGVIETLKVEYENREYMLNELALLSRKSPTLLVVNMVNFPQAIKAVLETIGKSGLNINPQQEGTTIYLPIPPLTREHRENLAKNAKILFVKTSDELRHIQNETIKKLKNKKSDFSEDLVFEAQQQVMKITNDTTSECDLLMQNKQNELLKE